MGTPRAAGCSPLSPVIAAHRRAKRSDVRFGDRVVGQRLEVNELLRGTHVDAIVADRKGTARPPGAKHRAGPGFAEAERERLRTFVLGEAGKLEAANL